MIAQSSISTFEEPELLERPEKPVRTNGIIPANTNPDSLFLHPRVIASSMLIPSPSPGGNDSPPDAANFFCMKIRHSGFCLIYFQYRF